MRPKETFSSPGQVAKTSQQRENSISVAVRGPRTSVLKFRITVYCTETQMDFNIFVS